MVAEKWSIADDMYIYGLLMSFMFFTILEMYQVSWMKKMLNWITENKHKALLTHDNFSLLLNTLDKVCNLGDLIPCSLICVQLAFCGSSLCFFLLLLSSKVNSYQEHEFLIWIPQSSTERCLKTSALTVVT